MHYQITSGDILIGLSKKENQVLLNEQPVDYEILSQSQDGIKLKLNHKIFHIEIIKRADEDSGWKIKINGKETEVTVKSELDLLLEKFSGGSGNQSSARQIKAPMPGLIVKLVASEGDEVSKGQVLLNFEAMKMENQLKSPGNGKVKSIMVKPGDKVEKGQILIEMQ
jgi:biotin carboxyl carrier protein